MSKAKLGIVFAVVITIIFFGSMILKLAAYDANDLQRLLATKHCPGVI